MRKITFFLIAALLIISSKTHANHLFGGTLNYKFISASGPSSTYQVTLELYGTCIISTAQSPVPDMTTLVPEVELYKSGARIKRFNLAYIPDLTKDVTPVCPDYADFTSCKNVFSFYYYSVIKYVYIGEVTLNEPAPDWSFVFNGFLNNAFRAEVYNDIQNIRVMHTAASESAPVPYDIMYLEATLNNVDGPNNSVIYTSPPISFNCKGYLAYYGMGAADADLDNLKFKVIPARIKLGSYHAPVIQEADYVNPPFTGLRPLPTAPDSFSLNASNGQMIFMPNDVVNCLVAVETEEYRDGKLVGTTIREMTFIINDDCNAEAPTTQTSNIVNMDHAVDLDNNLFLSACEGLMDTASLDINVSDPNNDNITVSYDNLPAAALITVDDNGSQNPVVHFKWGATDAVPANYLFYLTYTDDGCPVATKRNIAYTVTIVPHNIQFESTASGSCAEVADGKASVKPIGNVDIDYNYKWFDTTGNLLRNVNSNNGDNIENLPPGNYKVRIRNQEGCGKNIYITIDTTFPPKVLLPNDSTVCEGMPILLSTRNENGVNYQWSNGQNTCCIYAKQTGNYTLTASNHCGTASESVTLDFVKCNYCFFVPNAFSPNGDGQNDLFEIIPTCLFQSFKIQIFNREGRLMFVSYSLSDKWNGTYKGKELAQATYYYVIEAVYQDASKGKLKLTGDVTLLR